MTWVVSSLNPRLIEYFVRGHRGGGVVVVVVVVDVVVADVVVDAAVESFDQRGSDLPRIRYVQRDYCHCLVDLFDQIWLSISLPEATAGLHNASMSYP